MARFMKRGLLNLSRLLVPGHQPPACKSCLQQLRNLHISPVHQGVFEPDDLNTGPEIPEYEVLHVKLQGYDFVTLESFAKYVHNLANSMELKTDSWALPAMTLDVQTFRPLSTNIQNTYSLSTYQRVVKLQDVPSYKYPLFLETVRLQAPEGVQIISQLPDPVEEEFRYVPDRNMQELQQQLDDIDAAREERKKK